MKNKGEIAIEDLWKLLVVIILFLILISFFVLFKDKLVLGLKSIKNFFRFGR